MGAAGAGALEAILAAALLLPGVTGSGARAQELEDAASLQASRYRESPRPIGLAGGHGQPLAVDTRTLRVTLGAQGRDRLDLGYTQDTWSGATPVATAPVVAGGNRAVPRPGADGLVLSGASPMLNGHLLLDAADRPVQRDANGRVRDAPELVHTLSSASPETRQQLDLKLTRRIDGGSLAFGGGASLERDYRSRFINVATRIDREGTTVTLGLSATRSTIDAALDHDAVPYLTRTAYASQLAARDGQQVLTARRDDWAATASATQVLGPGALLSATVSGAGSRGYLGNPYKATSVIFAAPGGSDGVRDGDLRALLEQRPGQRRQWGADGKLVLQQGASEAAWHIGLGTSGDDWGVRARRAEVEWWLPLAGDALFSARLRGYSQQAARFYTPYLVSRQAYRQITIGPGGQFVLTGYDPALLPAHFASDTRLGAYGVLTAGLGWTARPGRGVQLDVSLDASLQSGRYAWGGRGDGRYADVRYRVIQASLKIDLEPRAAGAAGPAGAGGNVSTRADEAGGVPAELLPMLVWPAPGEWRIGYRQQQSRSGGALQAGSRVLEPADAAARACAGPCSAMPTGTTQQLQAADVLVRLDATRAVWVAPQFRVTRMDSALVPGTDAGHAPVHLGSHESGALGDTQVHLLWQPVPGGAPLWRWGLGLSVPTGHTTLAHRRVHQQDGTAMDYAMQSGTGTWDLLPSVTVQGGSGPLRWGAHGSAALRLQARNRDSYAWGPGGRVTGWLGWVPGQGLALTVRGAWRAEPGVVGVRADAPPALSSPDDPANHGGRHIDLGLGLSMTGGAGTLSVEALQPLRTWVRGVQPEPRTRWVIAIGRAL